MGNKTHMVSAPVELPFYLDLAGTKEVNKAEINTKQSFTEPPPRYTEASLVRALEEKETLPLHMQCR